MGGMVAETMTNKTQRRPRRQPRATTDALADLSHEADMGCNEPVDAALLQTPARGLQVVTVLAKKLHATPGDPNMQKASEGCSKTRCSSRITSVNRQRLAGTNRVLTTAVHLH